MPALRRYGLSIVFAFISFPLFSQEVVVNATVPVDSLTQTQLRSIFSMRVRTWNNNEPIKVFVLSGDSDLHRKFCLRTLEVFPYQLQRIWDVMLFSGTGIIPVEVKDAKHMLNVISKTPGAIGYVHSYEGDMPNVKTLHVQKTP